MIGPRDLLARDAEMPAETAAAMERRLLEAFAAHHAAAEKSESSPRGSLPVPALTGRSWRRWVAAAAAVVVFAAGVLGWRAVRSPDPQSGTAPSAAAPSPALPSAAPTPAPAPPVPTTAIARNGERAPVVDVVASSATGPRRASTKPPPRTPAVVRSSGVVALPGAAELPQFESGTIVRLELPVASLPGYGVDISRAGGDGSVEADVLVGQDGQARAIRLVTSQSSSSRSTQ
jgi:hypothetical protein